MNGAANESELRHAWTTLTQPQADELVRAIPVARTADGRMIRVAVDRAGNRTLSIATTTDDHPDVPPTDGSLRTVLRKLRFVTEAGEHLSIECTTSELFDVFAELCAELVDTMTRSDRPASAAVAQLDRWRELLRTRAVPNLSLQQELGLFGELWVLQALVESGTVDADMWTGPDRDSHDFDLGPSWVEVKTVGSSRTSFTVHGLDQLDTADGRGGNLVVLEVAEAMDGLTIGDIVGGLDATLGPEALVEKLAMCRWSRTHPDRRWAVETCLVADAVDVPRIVRASLPGGVPGGIRYVTYDVDVDVVVACAAHGRHHVTAIGLHRD